MTEKRNTDDSYNRAWGRFNCDPSDLTKKITVEEAEKANMITIRKSGEQVPFGYVNFLWKRLLDQMEEGDNLFEFNSDDESWDNLAGRAGLALVRDGKIIADMITSMN